MRDFETLSRRAALRNGVSLFQLKKLPTLISRRAEETRTSDHGCRGLDPKY